MADLWQLEKEQRRASILSLPRSLHDKHALRKGMTLDTAADTIWALIGPELHELLVRDRGWSPGRYERWLVDAMCSILLAGGAPTPDAPHAS
ncbi:MAG TPA: hypothetical protein VIR57_11535 [Chloroflexota bacterium]